MRCQNDKTEVACRIPRGREFQKEGAAKEKERWPKEKECMLGTRRILLSEEEWRVLFGV